MTSHRAAVAAPSESLAADRDESRPTEPGWIRWFVAGEVASVIAIYLYGLGLLLSSEEAFLHWIREDGLVEWLTCGVLFVAAGWAALVARGYQRCSASRIPVHVWWAVACLCLFGALEEISYGQRIMGIPTPRFLLPSSTPATDFFYNRQSEVTLHNLVIGGLNVNKVVFGKLLALVLMLYFLVLPVLHRRSSAIARRVDRWGIPVACGYQSLIFLAAAVANGVLRTWAAGKVAEMQELVGSTMFLALIMTPSNRIPRPVLAGAGTWVKSRLAALRPSAARLRLTLAAVGLQVLAGSVFRILFLLVFRSTAGELPAGGLLRALYLGAKFDLRLALLICLPLVLLSGLPGLNPARSPRAWRLWWGYLAAVQSIVFFMYLVDFGHYDYLHARLNADVLDHVRSTQIALQMVWETYPVLPALMGVGLLTAGYVLPLRRLRSAVRSEPERSAPRTRRVLVAVVLGMLYLFGIYGKWSWYPLRWSDAFASPNEFLSALALNPVLFFFDTFPDRGPDHDVNRVREGYDSVASLLEVDSPDRARLSFARAAAPRTTVPFRPNLVLIHLESFAGYKTGTLGNRLDASPEFDRIARDSLLFTNFFVPSAPTARSVFTMVTGIPDINPGRSASRNPRLVEQRTLINALEGYPKLYFLGGSATWANIRGILAHNIPGLRIYEEGDYAAARVNTWGVPDMDLFEKAHEVFQSETEPFFAFIQTAGNHKPFTIPENRRGFELSDLDEETVRENGFKSVEAYNGFRLLDYSLGHFFRLARQSPYYERTLFVMYGDHGYPAQRPIPFERLALTGHHVPLAILVPWDAEGGRRIDTVASLVDVLPTCLGLMGVPSVNTTLGRDLLVPRPAERRFALITQGLLTDDYLLRVDPVGHSHLFAYRSDSATDDLRDDQAIETARLRGMYDDLIETTRFLLYNNAPPPDTDPSAAHHER